MNFSKPQLEKMLADKEEELSSYREKMQKIELEYRNFKQKSEEDINKLKEKNSYLENELKKREDAYNRLLNLSNSKDLDIKTYLKELKDLNNKLDEEKQNTQDLTAKNQSLQKELEDVRNVAKQHEEKILDISKKRNDVEVEVKDLPGLSVCMDSIMRLNNPKTGWALYYSDAAKYELLKKKALIFIAVIGMYDVGKSWFCNRLAGRDVLASGYSQRTNSLDFLFPSEEDGSLIGIIDTPGSNEAIKVTDEDLIDLLKTTEEEKGDTPKSKNLEQIYFNRYKKLKNDARIIQDLKERFIREITDILVVVCNKLSEKEQEILYKVISNHKEVSRDRLREASDNRREVRETTLIVVHNFKNQSTIEQVTNQIKKDLAKSFRIEETPMFSESRSEFKDLNQTMYQDQFGIMHLILACEGTEAGTYFNRTTFAYLKNKMSTMVQRTQIDIPKAFVDFCNKNLPSILKQDIKLKFNKDQTAIVKDEDSKNIVLEILQYDEFGNFSVFSTTFEPRYSIDEKVLEPGKRELTIEVELLNSEFKATYLRHQDGMYYLNIEGKKYVLTGVDLNTGIKSLSNNRELGDFKLKIPLTDEELKGLRKEPKEGRPADGIMKYIFTFEKHTAIEI